MRSSRQLDVNLWKLFHHWYQFISYSFGGRWVVQQNLWDDLLTTSEPFSALTIQFFDCLGRNLAMNSVRHNVPMIKLLTKNFSNNRKCTGQYWNQNKHKTNLETGDQRKRKMCDFNFYICRMSKSKANIFQNNTKTNMFGIKATHAIPFSNCLLKKNKNFFSDVAFLSRGVVNKIPIWKEKSFWSTLSKTFVAISLLA